MTRHPLPRDDGSDARQRAMGVASLWRSFCDPSVVHVIVNTAHSVNTASLSIRPHPRVRPTMRPRSPCPSAAPATPRITAAHPPPPDRHPIPPPVATHRPLPSIPPLGGRIPPAQLRCHSHPSPARLISPPHQPVLSDSPVQVPEPIPSRQLREIRLIRQVTTGEEQRPYRWNKEYNSAANTS